MAVDIREFVCPQSTLGSDVDQIIEGLLTQVTAMAAWFLIIDFPDKAERKRFLTHEQATFILKRIEDDRGDSIPDSLTWRKFFHHLSDLKLWALYVFIHRP